MWHATPTREDTNPNQNRRSCPRILAAVAAALPETISLPRTNTWPKADVRPSSTSKTPAIRALKRGDVSVIGSIISSPPRQVVLYPRQETSLTWNLRWESGGWGRLMGQGSSAVRTVDVIPANQALALRTARAQFVTAARAEVESRLNGVPTLRAGTVQRLPQDEEKNDAKRVGNKNGHNRPKQGAHAAAFRVAVDVSNEQQIAATSNAGQ
jgi:hypothetical protein